MRWEAPGRLRRASDSLASWLEMGLSPKEAEVLTDMSQWTRIRVRMAQEEIGKRELRRQEKIVMGDT